MPRNTSSGANHFRAVANEHHFFNPNPLKRFSLGTKNQNLQTNSDGSLTLHAGAKSPGKDKETNWLPAPK